jgi:hypothetical protein
VLVSCCLLNHRKKTIIALFQTSQFFFLLIFFGWWYCSVTWSSLHVSALVYVLACVSCSVVRYIICIILWRIIINQSSIFAAFLYKKERTQKKERIGKRDIEVNIIDIEKKEREEERENDRSSIHTYICQSVLSCVSLSLFAFTFTKYIERTKLSVLNEMCVQSIVDHFCCIWISTLTFVLLVRIDDPLETKLINSKWQ